VRTPALSRFPAAAAPCCVPLLSPTLSLLYPISLPCSLSHARTRRPPGHRARRPGRPAPSAPDRGRAAPTARRQRARRPAPSALPSRPTPRSLPSRARPAASRDTGAGPCVPRACSLRNRPSAPARSRAMRARTRASRADVRACPSSLHVCWHVRSITCYVKDHQCFRFFLPHYSLVTDASMAMKTDRSLLGRLFLSLLLPIKSSRALSHSFLLELASFSSAPRSSLVPLVVGVAVRRRSHALTVRSRALLSTRPNPVELSPSHVRT
jgi:hypothetical protein